MCEHVCAKCGKEIEKNEKVVCWSCYNKLRWAFINKKQECAWMGLYYAGR